MAVLTPVEVTEQEPEELRVPAVDPISGEVELEDLSGELPPELRPRGIKGLLNGRIDAKIVVPFFVVMFGLAIIGTFVVLQLITSSLVQRFQTQLLNAGKNANDSVIKAETQELQLVRLMADTEGVDQAIVKADKQTLQSLLLPLQANSTFNYIDVVDASGNEVFSIRADQKNTGTDASIGQWQVSKDSLANKSDQFGNLYTGLVDASYGGFLYSGGAVTNSSGAVVGAVLVGMPFQDLITQVAKDAVAAVTVYRPDGTIFGTTLPIPANDHSLDLTKATISTVYAPGSLDIQKTYQRPITVKGTHYMELVGGLLVRDKVGGGLGVALTSTSIDQASASARTNMSGVFTGVTFLVLIIGIYVANRIRTPLRLLVHACQLVARGEFDHKVSVRTKDETGVLAHSFNQMIDGLKERDRIRDTFGRYMTQQVSDAILKGEVKLGGELRDLTIFMTNIRGFEQLSEKMPANELVTFLNRYFSEMIDCVVAHDGVVDKFMEDAILVVYGAPVHDDEHPTKAVLTALDMRERLIPFNEQLIAEGHEPIRIGIGINSGQAVTGNIGSDVRMEYTVISDTVNSTQRTRELTDDFGTDILLSEATAARIDGRFVLGAPRRITIRGRRQESCIYPLVGVRSVEADPSRLERLPVVLSDSPEEDAPRPAEAAAMLAPASHEPADAAQADAATAASAEHVQAVNAEPAVEAASEAVAVMDTPEAPAAKATRRRAGGSKPSANGAKPKSKRSSGKGKAEPSP